MATTRFELPVENEELFDGQTDYTAADITRVNRIVDSQLGGWMASQGSGVITYNYGDNSLKVSPSTGLAVNIEAGEAMLTGADFGACYVEKPAASVRGNLPANRGEGDPVYLHAAFTRGGTDDSHENARAVFLLADTEALDGGVLLAEITTGGASVVAVVDRRKKTLLDRALSNEGDWSESEAYRTGSLVFHNEGAWIAQVANSGSEPGAGNSDWKQLGGNASGSGIPSGGITDAHVATGAGIDAAKLGTGGVSNDELAALDGIEGNIQEQLNNRPTNADLGAAVADTFEAGTNINITPSGDGKYQIAATGELSAETSRSQASYTSPAINTGAFDDSGTIDLGRTAIVLRVASDVPAWIRAYISEAHRTADINRGFTDPPANNHGLVFDVVTTPGLLSVPLAPLAQAANLESIPVPTYPLLIQNMSGTTSEIEITIDKITLQS